MKWSMMFLGVAILILLPFSVQEASSDDSASDDFDAAKYERMKKTCEWFKNGDISFGFGWDGDLFCTPSYLRSRSITDNDFLQKYRYQVRGYQGEFGFWPFADSIMANYVSNSSGDTALLVWPKGKTKVIITQIGFYETTCFEGLRCKLELVDSTMITPSGNFLVLVGELANYSGPIISYAEYPADDQVLVSILDSLRGELDEAYYKDLIARFKDNNPIADSTEIQRLITERLGDLEAYFKKTDRIRSKLYGVEQPSIPDTLHLLNHCWYFSTESGWGSHYLLVRNDKSWKIETICGPKKGGSGVGKIICALDLNGDGELEYLSDPGSSIGLWMYFDGDTMSLKGSGRGC